MSEALFFRLLSDENKDEALREVILAAREGKALNSVVFSVDPASFEQVTGAPFAYWVSDNVRRLFRRLPQFEDQGRRVERGLFTSDDFRFIRCYWEIASESILKKKWSLLSKGGAFARYYYDVHLCVLSENDFSEIRSVILGKYTYLNGNTDWVLHPECSYGRAGLTYALRTTSDFAVRCLPAGCYWTNKGISLFENDSTVVDAKLLFIILAVSNSRTFRALLALRMGAATAAARSYEEGIVAQMPWPPVLGREAIVLEQNARLAFSVAQQSDSVQETSHVFTVPAIIQSSGDTLMDRSASWQHLTNARKEQLAEHQHEIDEIAFGLYGIDDEDRQAMETTLYSSRSLTGDEEVEEESQEDTGVEKSSNDYPQMIGELLSYSVGCAFGRWDVRYATGERSTPKLPEPFAPLPVCASGALIGADGLPLRKSPPGYPLRVDWDGILVDDPQRDDDIIRRTRDVFELIWQKRAEEIEREACELLDVKALRDYFRKPAAGGFWMDHVKRYSKSRRKAPIYWLLRSSKGNYAVLLYYHRLDKDILFKALLNYVEPKLRLEENNLAQLNQRRQIVGTSGREGKQLEKDLDKQESFLSELYDFRDRLKRAADLNVEPDLNDGVVLNIAPLWELVPWKEAEKYWKELIAGKYEWSSIGKQLRERGLVKQ